MQILGAKILTSKNRTTRVTCSQNKLILFLVNATQVPTPSAGPALRGRGGGGGVSEQTTAPQAPRKQEERAPLRSPFFLSSSLPMVAIVKRSETYW